MKALIARKIGMTSTISEDGAVKAVTLLSVSPNTVIQHKTVEKDGYNAVQIGREVAKHPAKAQIGHFKASKVQPKIVREFRVEEIGEDLSVGAELSSGTFEVGDQVDATAISKGKGFAGTIKRHNFHRGRKTHGGRSYRRVGSIGSMYPQHILKGKKMSGRMGHARVTVKHLKVALIDKELGVIGVQGAVPGPKRGIVTIQETR